MSVILMLSKCIFRQALIMNIVLTSLVLQKQAVVSDKTFKNNFLPYILVLLHNNLVSNFTASFTVIRG